MPAKSRKSRKQSNEISISIKDKWHKILNDIDKPNVPVSVMDRMVLILVDGSKLEIDIKELVDQYQNLDEIEELVNSKLEEMNHLIRDVDFFVDVEAVAKTVQPITDKLLSKL